MTPEKLRPYEGSRRSTTWRTSSPTRPCSPSSGSSRERPLAVVRTPPAVSLYHRFEAPVFTEVLHKLKGEQVVVLPRTPEQRAELAREGGFIVPEQAIDAQSLIAFADLVISAGGTMNREAVALGTPVWTTFEGRLGAVDERLIDDGRMQRLMSADEVVLERREDGAAAPAARPPRPRDPHGSVREGALGAGLRAARPNTLPRMRRRLRSAAFPIHRHALPQLALDAGLVALAYYLAYRLRFDGGIPTVLHGPLLAHARVRHRRLAVLLRRRSACTGTGCGTRRSASTSRSPQGVVLAVLALVGYVAIVQPQLISTGDAASSPARCRPACSRCSGC